MLKPCPIKASSKAQKKRSSSGVIAYFSDEAVEYFTYKGRRTGAGPAAGRDKPSRFKMPMDTASFALPLYGFTATVSSVGAQSDNDKSNRHTIIYIVEVMLVIAERIKELRQARGWTQADLARRLSITRNGVNSWEQGLSTPSPASLVDLARLFSVSTDYLLGVEPLNTVNVTGLDERDVAILAELADRLRQHKADE